MSAPNQQMWFFLSFCLSLSSVGAWSQDTSIWQQYSKEEVSAKLPKDVLQTSCSYRDVQNKWVCDERVRSRYLRTEKVMIEVVSSFDGQVSLKRDRPDLGSCISHVDLKIQPAEDMAYSAVIIDGHGFQHALAQSSQESGWRFSAGRLVCLEYMLDEPEKDFDIIISIGEEKHIRIHRSLVFSSISYLALLKMNPMPDAPHVYIPWSSSLGGLFSLAGTAVLAHGYGQSGWGPGLNTELMISSGLLGFGVPLLVYGMMTDRKAVLENGRIKRSRTRYVQHIFDDPSEGE